MRVLFASLCAASAIGSAALAQQTADAVQPEGATTGALTAISPAVAQALAAKEAGVPVEANTWMVAAANPHAVEAGAAVLRRGGTSQCDRDFDG